MKASSYYLVSIAFNLCTLFTSVLSAQTSSIFWIKIQTPIDPYYDSLIFGNHIYGSYGIDSSLGEYTFGAECYSLCSYWRRDRKSTRLNSSHLVISYAVFCLKKKKNQQS